MDLWCNGLVLFGVLLTEFFLCPLWAAVLVHGNVAFFW